ncbi:hypothetical protein AAC387_Pa05g2906 [Persea americana]
MRWRNALYFFEERPIRWNPRLRHKRELRQARERNGTSATVDIYSGESQVLAVHSYFYSIFLYRSAFSRKFSGRDLSGQYRVPVNIATGKQCHVEPCITSG